MDQETNWILSVIEIGKHESIKWGDILKYRKNNTSPCKIHNEALFSS